MTISYIILFITISWVLKAIFSEWLYPWVDAKLYCRIYEKKIQNDPAKGNGIVPDYLRWLFKEYPNYFGFKNAVPRYRVFQKAIMIGYWIAAYFVFYSHFPWWITAGCFSGVLWAYYWMKHERRYYYWADQEVEMYEYQSKRVNVYWLSRGYFSGYWMFPGGHNFAGWKFDLSSIVGTFGLYLASAITFFIYYIIKGV